MSGPRPEAAAALRVPYDVLEHVAVFADQASLLALCHVSHKVSSLATRQLYRYVVFTYLNGHAAVTFLELIARNPSLGKLVVSLSIQVVNNWSLSHRTFVDALRLMQMLRHLDVSNIEEVEVSNSCKNVLRGLTRLESFRFLATHDTTITGPAAEILDSLPPLKRFHFGQIIPIRLAPRLRHVEHLLLRSADTLVSLTILNRNFDLGGFLAETGPATVWPHLKELTVHKISVQFPAYSFPNLEQLHIYRDDSSDEFWRGFKRVPDPVGGKLAISSNSAPVVFPKLTRLSTVAVDSKHFSDVLEQRNIRHLAVRSSEMHHADFVLFMPIFSFAALHSLQCSFHWTPYMSGTPPVLSGLPEVLEQCPVLHYLGMTVKRNSKNALELVSALFGPLDDVQPQTLPPQLWYISVRALKSPFASLRAANDTDRVYVEVDTIAPLFAQFLGLRCFQLDMDENVDVWRSMDLKAGGNSAAEPVISRDANFRLPATFEEVIARVELECA